MSVCQARVRQPRIIDTSSRREPRERDDTCRRTRGDGEFRSLTLKSWNTVTVNVIFSHKAWHWSLTISSEGGVHRRSHPGWWSFKEERDDANLVETWPRLKTIISQSFYSDWILWLRVVSREQYVKEDPQKGSFAYFRWEISVFYIDFKCIWYNINDKIFSKLIVRKYLHFRN